MLNRILALIVFIFISSFNSSAIAYNIKNGTVSIGGASNILFGNYDSHNTSDTDLIIISTNCGYFFVDNLEIGALLSAGYQDDDNVEYKYLSMSPLVSYHFELNEASNFFITGMIGFVKSYYNSENRSSEMNEILLSTAIGWEYFFNKTVAGILGITYTRTETDFGSNNGYASDSFTTNFGFKIYF